MPQVLNLERLMFSNASPISVTDFLYGQEGQSLIILGDGQTTLVHNLNIQNNTSANKLLASGSVYHYVRLAGKWREVN